MHTLGTPDSDVVLRGADSGPNYGADSVSRAMSEIRKELPEDSAASDGLIIDCPHGNSGKDGHQQARVVRNIASRIAGGERGMSGVMMESVIEGGTQPAGPLPSLIYGKSITDRCLSWTDTETLLRDLAQAVLTRRWI